jgi:hypothetical protein
MLDLLAGTVLFAVSIFLLLTISWSKKARSLPEFTGFYPGSIRFMAAAFLFIVFPDPSHVASQNVGSCISLMFLYIY